MKILKIIIIGIVLLIFEISMFQISLEIGLSSLVLISTVLCILILLTKITTVVVYPELVLSSEPFRNSGTAGKKEKMPVNQRTSDSENIIPNVDSNIFEQFRKNLNLNPVTDPSPVTSLSPGNTANLDVVKEAYEKTWLINGPDNFSEELDEAENVKVTLSENVKQLQEEKFEEEAENKNENTVEVKEEVVSEMKESSKLEKTGNERKLGAGEEALEILSRKHQALRQQTESSTMEQPSDFDEDIFADELIPLPGGESFFEPENELFRDEDPFNSPMESYNLEDEINLGTSLQKTTPQDEKISEAEALLKLATTACETGRIEEAKASLESYLGLLYELGQTPSQDVQQLAEKLEIPLDSNLKNSVDSQTSETKKDLEKKPEPILKDVPEQTNYANVMDGIVKLLEEKESYEEALPLLKDLLNYNRQRVNISAMDPLYDRIEQAYSSMKNDEDLVATYKEHLAIKQQLDDLEGELHLLDLISYYYANTGDQKASERYQAESKLIKASLDKIAREEQGV